MFLGLKGHHLEVAPTGPLALDMARRCRPDVVLLDIGLPGLDGFEVARELHLVKPADPRVIEAF